MMQKEQKVLNNSPLIIDESNVSSEEDETWLEEVLDDENDDNMKEKDFCMSGASLYFHVLRKPCPEK
eukprot:1323813-Ditylum_brightwellii.AAC.1